MSPSKETLEAVSPAAKTAAPAAPSKADINKLRADAVSLDVPVRVHGSRVTDVVRGVTPHTEPFEEEASTMIVFPHGGVVRMATTVGVGQMLVLTNLRTSQDAICRVVKVRAYSNSQAYVEVEFTHRQVGYWGVHFPADDEESFPVPAPPEPAASEPENKPVVSSVTVKVEAMPKISPPMRNESVFAPIGSQEEVQPPAAHTETKSRFTPLPARVPAASIASVAPPPAPKAAPPAHSSAAIDTPPETIESDIDIDTPSRSQTFGTLTGGTARNAQSAVSSDFGARLDSNAAMQAAAPRTNNWMWIAACLFFLVAGLAGGAFYFRQRSSQPQGEAQSQSPAVPSQSATPAPSAPVAQSPVTPQPTQPDASIAAAAAPTAAVAERTNRTESRSMEQQPRLANESPSRELKPAAPVETATAPKSFAPTDARPVARSIGSNRIAAPPSLSAAPTVTATPGGSEALPGVFASSETAPPPPPSQQPLTRVRVGGVIVQPRLLRSTAPNYPSAARSAGISGNVVIQAHVDKAGNIASMKVISGPATLQSAAMSALRMWKYQPATLDGVPIATDVTVTIKFQQQ